MVAFDRESNFSFGSSENPTLRDKKNRAELDFPCLMEFFPAFFHIFGLINVNQLLINVN